jgi:hypothetical protein
MIMKYIDIDPVAEVRRNRELLLEIHGGIEGLLEYMDEQRPELEQQGWEFVSAEDIAAKKYSQKEIWLGNLTSRALCSELRERLHEQLQTASVP